MDKINNIINKLQASNHKSAYLSITRVLLALFLLKEILFKYSSWQLLYSNSTQLIFKTHSIFKVGGIDVNLLKSNYQIIILFYCIALLLMVFGIGKRLIVFNAFLLLFTLQKINNAEVNGGDVFARFIMFCLCFANSFEYLCYKKKTTNSTTENVVSNLAALSIMLNLCLAYFMAGYQKILNPYWQDGTAMYYVLQTEAYNKYELSKSLAHQTWFVYFSTFFTLFVELCFPILIWIKKLRKTILTLGILLHVGIYFLMMLYNLQFVFVLIYGFFLSNKFWSNLLNKLRLA